MKALSRYLRSLLLLLAGALPAVAAQAAEAAMGSFSHSSAPGDDHSLSLLDAPMPAILMVMFGIMIVYAAYRYWADNSHHGAD